MDAETRLRQAHTWAQQCFAEMVNARAYGDPTAEATIAYVAAERRVDDLLRDAQWEASKAKLDALITADMAEMAR